MNIISTQPTNLIWPNNLYAIRITAREKALIERRVHSSISQLLPQSPTLKPNYEYPRGANHPRRTIVTHQYALIVLNRKGGMPLFSKSGADQKNMKYAWDCLNGKFWVKKRFTSPSQVDMLACYIFSPEVGKSRLGIPNIYIDTTSFRKGKMRYFEEVSESSLPKNHPGNLDINDIVGLIDALRKIHTATFCPATYSYSDESIMTSKERTLFHGDISPSNILCNRDPKTGAITQLKLSDYGNLGDTNRLMWTRGWGSPEIFQYLRGDEKFKNMDKEQFLVKYGTKKDTWAMGLLIGSILRSRFHPQFDTLYPCFSFISNRFTLDPTRKKVLSDKGLADLTQEEVDNKIDPLVSEASSELIKQLWLFVKNCLIVDPDKRPNLTENFLEERENIWLNIIVDTSNKDSQGLK